MVWTVARERDMPIVSRAAAGTFRVVALLWLGNVRILMHGNELAHALATQRLSMFSEPAFDLVEHGWHAPPALPAPLVASYAHVVREFDDPEGHRRVASFEGWMPRMDRLPPDPVLAVVDADGVLRGLAKMSFIGPGKESLRFNIPQKRGFDGYVLAPRSGETLSVLVLNASNTHVLANIPLDIPIAPPAG